MNQNNHNPFNDPELLLDHVDDDIADDTIALINELKHELWEIKDSRDMTTVEAAQYVIYSNVGLEGDSQSGNFDHLSTEKIMGYAQTTWARLNIWYMNDGALYTPNPSTETPTEVFRKAVTDALKNMDPGSTETPIYDITRGIMMELMVHAVLHAAKTRM